MIRKVTDKSRGIRLGNYVQIRTIEDEELEQVWAGKKTAKEGAGRDRHARQRAAGALRKSQQGLKLRRASRARDNARPPAGGRAFSDLVPWKNASSSAPRWLPWVLLAPADAGDRRLLLLARQPGAACSRCSCRTRSALDVAVGRAGELPAQLWNDPAYLESFKTTAVFSAAGRRASASACRCCWPCSPTASCAARMAYKTLLILPYAVAPAVAGVLWVFMFSPSLGVVAYALGKVGFDWNHLLQRHAGDDADRHGRGLEADFLQLPVLPGRPAVDPQVADRGRGHRRRRTPGGASGPSSSRCCRRPPSSCW